MASFFASSSDESRTFQVAKLFLQMYLRGMPAVFNVSSKISLLRPASLLVFRSVTANDRDLGSTASTNSGIGSILLSLKYFAYFSTRSLAWSASVFLFFVFAMTRRLVLAVAFEWVVLCWPMKHMINLPALGRVQCIYIYIYIYIYISRFFFFYFFFMWIVCVYYLCAGKHLNVSVKEAY